MLLWRCDYTVLLVTSLVVGVSLLMIDMAFTWFHLDDKISIFCEHISRAEIASASIESSAYFVPPLRVKLIKVVPPVEIEFVRFFVIIVNLNVVEEQVPRHVFCGKTITPSGKGWSPKVHAELLSFVQK